jgi:hypothetical protein
MNIADMGYRGIIRWLRSFLHFCAPDFVGCLIDGVENNLGQHGIANSHELAIVSVKEVLLWAAQWYEMRRIFLVFLRECTKPQAGQAICRAELQRAFRIWRKGRSVDFSSRAFGLWLRWPLVNEQLGGRVLLSPNKWKRPADWVRFSGFPTLGPWRRQDSHALEPLFTDVEFDLITEITWQCLSKLDRPNSKEFATDPTRLDRLLRPWGLDRTVNGGMASDHGSRPSTPGEDAIPAWGATKEAGLINLTRGIFDNPSNALVTDLVSVLGWSPKDAVAEVERQGYSPSWRSAEEVNRGVNEITKRTRNYKRLGDVLVRIEVWWQERTVQDAIRVVGKSGFKTSSRKTHFRWFEKTMPGFLRGNPKEGIRLNARSSARVSSQASVIGPSPVLGD